MQLPDLLGPLACKQLKLYWQSQTNIALQHLQLVRRLGESGTLQIGVRDEGASAERQLQVKLDSWLKGADEPDPIRSLGIRPWRPALAPVLAELDPKGPAQAGPFSFPGRTAGLHLPFSPGPLDPTPHPVAPMTMICRLSRFSQNRYGKEALAVGDGTA